MVPMIKNKANAIQYHGSCNKFIDKANNSTASRCMVNLNLLLSVNTSSKKLMKVINTKPNMNQGY